MLVGDLIQPRSDINIKLMMWNPADSSVQFRVECLENTKYVLSFEIPVLCFLCDFCVNETKLIKVTSDDVICIC